MDKEAFHLAAEERIATFEYTKPPAGDSPKDVLSLVRSGMLRVNVQIIRNGGENNLHYHLKSETAWLVLRGSARFYGVGDVLLGEFGPNQGIFIPGGSRYWFEKSGNEDLELLQMVGVEKAGDQRINVDQHKDWMTEPMLQVYAEEART